VRGVHSLLHQMLENCCNLAAFFKIFNETIMNILNRKSNKKAKAYSSTFCQKKHVLCQTYNVNIPLPVVN